MLGMKSARLWVLLSVAMVNLLSMNSAYACFGGREYVDNAGELFAIRVPGMANKQQLNLSAAKNIVNQYRWIYINSSCKSPSEAKHEATQLADAVGRPLMLVYMPRHIFDGQRNSYHPDFQSSLAALIENALSAEKNLLISAKSYGIHQSLRVIRRFDSPRILLTGISPAFGAFGNIWSEAVDQYISDVKDTRAKYCMIASKQDGFTWRRGGAAYRRNGTFRGDPNVGEAMESNSENVAIIKLSGADHSPITEYIDHGLVGAIKDCVDHFGMKDTTVGEVVYAQMFKPQRPVWVIPVVWMNLY